VSAPGKRSLALRVERDGPLVTVLAAILHGHHSMPGALCAGQAPRFDRDQLDAGTVDEWRERLVIAREVCARCPVRSTCPAPVGRGGQR
jgi:hypothetical protein